MRGKTLSKSKEKKLTLRNKNVLVTGGTGFVGSHLVDFLISEKPARIIAVDRSHRETPLNLGEAVKKFPQLETVKLNVSNYSGLKKLFQKNDIDVVFHLATLTLFESLKRPKKVTLSNVRMATNLLELQRLRFFQTLVLVSSSEAYGTAEHIPMSVDHPLNPTTPYAASKAAADLIALSYWRTFKNDVAIVRPFNQYGPRHNPLYKGIVTSTILALLAGREPVIYGTGDQTRDYIFVKDTVRGIIEAYKHPSTRGKVINLGTGKMITMNDLVRLLIKASGKKIDIKYVEGRVADVKNHCADISQTIKLIKWKPKTRIEAGLKETYEWYRSRSAQKQKNLK